MQMLPIMTTTVTGRNQITVPAALVERMGLKPGTRIEWRQGESMDEIVCRVLPDPVVLAAKLRGAGRAYLKADAIHPMDVLVAEREAEDHLREDSL